MSVLWVVVNRGLTVPFHLDIYGLLNIKWHKAADIYEDVEIGKVELNIPVLYFDITATLHWRYFILL